MRDLDWCVTNVLRWAEDLAAHLPRGSVLFPLLGTGTAGAEAGHTARTMAAAAVDYVRSVPDTRLRRVLFLGYDRTEYRAIEAALRANGLVPAGTGPPATPDVGITAEGDPGPGSGQVGCQPR